MNPSDIIIGTQNDIDMYKIAGEIRLTITKILDLIRIKQSVSNTILTKFIITKLFLQMVVLWLDNNKTYKQSPNIINYFITQPDELIKNQIITIHQILESKTTNKLHDLHTQINQLYNLINSTLPITTNIDENVNAQIETYISITQKQIRKFHILRNNNEHTKLDKLNKEIQTNKLTIENYEKALKEISEEEKIPYYNYNDPATTIAIIEQENEKADDQQKFINNIHLIKLYNKLSPSRNASTITKLYDEQYELIKKISYSNLNEYDQEELKKTQDTINQYITENGNEIQESIDATHQLIDSITESGEKSLINDAKLIEANTQLIKLYNKQLPNTKKTNDENKIQLLEGTISSIQDTIDNLYIDQQKRIIFKQIDALEKTPTPNDLSDAIMHIQKIINLYGTLIKYEYATTLTKTTESQREYFYNIRHPIINFMNEQIPILKKRTKRYENTMREKSREIWGYVSNKTTNDIENEKQCYYEFIVTLETIKLLRP